MVELVFANGNLREGRNELARLSPAAVISYREHEYQIVRTKTHGWHYAAEDRDSGRLAWSFEPLRLRRGGRLRSDSSAIALRGRLLAPTSWRLPTDDGQRIELRSQRTRSGLWSFAMTLRSEDAVAQIADLPIALLLGCWIAMSWQSVRVPRSEIAPGMVR